MSKAARTSVLLLTGAILLAQTAALAQRADRRALDAEFRVALSACREARDSGSLADAVQRLQKIAAADAAHPGLAELQRTCGEELNRQKTAEDLLFAEAKTAFERRNYDDARVKFQNLANRNTRYKRDANNYLNLVLNASGPGGGGTSISQQDYENLDLAKRHFKANDYGRAKPMFEVLLPRGGTLAAEAKKYLDLIELHERNSVQFQQGMAAIRQRRFQEGLDVLVKIQEQEPDYPELAYWIGIARKGLGPGAAPSQPAAGSAEFERGRKLLTEKDAAGALKVFRAVQAQPGAPADIQAWVQKAEQAYKDDQKQARIDRRVQDGERLMKRKDYAGARIQFQKALTEAPDDQEVAKLLTDANAAWKRSGGAEKPEDRSAIVETYLEAGVREYYAGNLAQTNRMLDRYVREGGKRAAVAYFYLAAAACTEFYLGGESDREKEARARELFLKGRQADARFTPPRDWVSPKIVATFEKTAAGQ